MNHSLFDILSGFGYLAVEILLDYAASDWHTECGPVAGIFHVYAHGNLRVMVGCETEEHRVVASMRVLGCAGLSGHFDAG